MSNLSVINGFIEETANPTPELLQFRTRLTEDNDYEKLTWWKKLFTKHPRFKRGDW